MARLEFVFAVTVLTLWTSACDDARTNAAGTRRALVDGMRADAPEFSAAVARRSLEPGPDITHSNGMLVSPSFVLSVVHSSNSPLGTAFGANVRDEDPEHVVEEGQCFEMRSTGPAPCGFSGIWCGTEDGSRIFGGACLAVCGMHPVCTGLDDENGNGTNHDEYRALFRRRFADADRADAFAEAYLTRCDVLDPGERTSC